MSFTGLLKNEQLMDIIFNQLGYSLIYVSSDALIKDANQVGIKILSLDKKNYLGLNLLAHCQNKKFELARLLNSCSKETSLTETYFNNTKSPQIISWEKKILSPLSLKNSSSDFLLIGKNTTNEHAVIDEFKSSVHFYENILSKLPTNVYWKDLNCVYMGCNERLAKSLGLSSPKAITGMTDYDFGWDKETAESFISFDKQIMDTEIPATTEDVFTESSGKVVTVLTNKTPLKDNNGKVIGVLAISVDITELKKTQEKYLNAKEKAEAANIAKSAFISNIGHDLNTPFIGIEGNALILYDLYEEKDPLKKELWDDMIAGTAEYTKVLKEIIHVATLEDPAVQLVSLSINEELEIVKKLMLATAHAKKLDFIINLLDGESDIIETDRLRFRLILISLISNAIQFTEKGTITVSLLKKDHLFQIMITDTGIGIPADKFDCIFEPFTKLSPSNTHTTFKGIGSGLSIAKQRAQELEATIHVESIVGTGSTFTLSIPVHPK